MKSKQQIMLILGIMLAGACGPLHAMEAEPRTDEQVVLQSNDGQLFSVDLKAAQISGTLKNLIEDSGIVATIPIPNVDGKTLESVVYILRNIAKLPLEIIASFRKLGLSQAEMKNITSPLIRALFYLDIPQVVILRSSDSPKKIMPFRGALQSTKIMDLIDESGEITLPNSNYKTLAVITQLISILNPLLHANQEAKPEDQIYIPRAYQPQVNTILKDLTNTEIGTLYTSAVFLDIPFIINAIAAVIADRIHVGINEYTRIEVGNISIAWGNKNLNMRRTFMMHLLQREGILINQIDYVIKHMLLRTRGIRQEYSISDLIRSKGQPKLWHYEGKSNSITLMHEELTSLFGIHLIKAKDQAQTLWIEYNNLFDISLDPQPAHEPFKGFTHLQTLLLRANGFVSLPKNFFTGLENLKTLSLHLNNLIEVPEELLHPLINVQLIDLSFNQLTNIPDTFFQKLTHLLKIDLSENKLTRLPNQLFDGLLNLKMIDIGANELSYEEKARIKKELPKAFLGFGAW